MSGYMLTRLSYFNAYGITSAWIIGGQKQVGFIDLAAGLLTTRNVSQVTSSDDGAGYYSIDKSPTVTIIDGAVWNECFQECYHGPVVKDDMSIGNMTVPQVLVMACDDSCHGGSANWGMSRGLVLGYSVNGEDACGPSFFATLKSQLTQPLWTLWLDNGRGLFNFGYIQDNLHTGDIGYVYNNNDRGFWNSKTTGWSVAGGPSNLTADLYFYLDTANPTSAWTPQMFDGYHSAIPGSYYDSSGNYHHPCEETLPELTIYMNGVPVTIQGENFKGGNVDDDICWTTPIRGSDPESTYNNVWAIDFLQGVFSVFEYSNDDNSDRIGFATKKPASS